MPLRELHGVVRNVATLPPRSAIMARVISGKAIARYLSSQPPATTQNNKHRSFKKYADCLSSCDNVGNSELQQGLKEKVSALKEKIPGFLPKLTIVQVCCADQHAKSLRDHLSLLRSLKPRYQLFYGCPSLYQSLERRYQRVRFF